MKNERQKRRIGEQKVFSGNPFRKVVFESLKKNKTRTAVTIIGIILSAAMICAVTTFAVSVQQYMVENATYQTGNWHGRVTGVSYKTYEKVQADAEVKSAAFFQQLGYAKAEGCTNAEKPYIYLLGFQPGGEQAMPIHLLSGRYPVSQDEILLPKHLETNGGVVYELGDKLTLDLGQRIQTQDNEVLDQNNPCFYTSQDGESGYYDEEIRVRETRTYTVVGFCERIDWRLEDYYAPGYTAFTMADEEVMDGACYDVYFLMKRPGEIYDYMNQNGLEGYTNSTALLYSGVSKYDSFYWALYGLAAIVIALIMFGSVSLIYNAFSISVSERTKQFGLLASIGATKKQLRKMVLFEAMCVSVAGIPFGICAGIGGIGVTIFLLGDRFLQIGFPTKMHLEVSSLSVLIAAVIALTTVLISAWIPAKRATKISAIEAIRQSADISAAPRAGKTSGFIYRLFGLPGMLADKYFKRSKKRYRATILSLFMSIVLFVCTSAFTEYLMVSVNGGLVETEYDLDVRVPEEDFTQVTPQKLMEEMGNIKGVTDIAMLHGLYESVRIPGEYLTERGLASLYQWDVQPLYLEENEENLNIYIRFVDDGSYRKLLKENHLSEEVYMNPEHPQAVVLDGIQAFNRDTGRYETTKILKDGNLKLTMVIPKEREGYWFSEEFIDENGNKMARYERNTGDASESEEQCLEIPLEEAYTETVLRIGEVIYDRPFYEPSGIDGIALFYPVSLKETVLAGTGQSTEVQYYLLAENHREAAQKIKTMLSDYGMANGAGVYDAAENEETERSMIVIFRVFAYGFIVLISLIAVANVFNTITTNINLRRREFAMLKSVGMAERDFHRMMNFECILYGTRALVYGIPVSAGVTWLIWKVICQAYETEFVLPWMAIGIAALGVFAVVFVTMLYAMRKVKKENIMDALKNENL